jgi:hypothetical protein
VRITSVAVALAKEDLLDVLEDFQASPVLEAEDIESVSALSHAENVSDWVSAIARYFTVAGEEVISWSELCEKIILSPVEIWLGLLSGNFVLKQTESEGSDYLFYESEIIVRF